MGTRKSPEAREVQLERRNSDRYGKRAEYRHARNVKRFERNAAAASYAATFGEV